LKAGSTILAARPDFKDCAAAAASTVEQITISKRMTPKGAHERVVGCDSASF
jgi:hypothetical protein